MSVSVEGLDNILKNLEAKLGERRTTRVVNKALRSAGEKSQKIVEDATATYIRTGETNETVIASNIKKNPYKSIEIGWGAGSRWRLVHLSEFGYTRYGKYVRPRGMGQLRGAVDEIESTIVPEMQKELKELGQ